MYFEIGEHYKNSTNIPSFHGGRKPELCLMNLHFLKNLIEKNFLLDHVRNIKTDSVYYLAWLLNIIELFIIYVMRDYHDRK